MSELAQYSEGSVEQLVNGQLVMDMFETMAYNDRHHRATAALRNRELKDALGRVIELKVGETMTFRDWGLRLRVTSLRAGSLIMRHGGQHYLDQLEDGVPTVTGLVTSINCDSPSFNIDPGTGAPDKGREVSVIPFDHKTLEKRVSIDVVSIGEL